MAYIDFVGKVHKKTSRNYIERVTDNDKAFCAEIAGKFSEEYWDGDRCYGFGGYRYDGRWSVVAKAIVEHYKIKPGDKILDVGCGKGFLLYEFIKLIPNISVCGIDISEYAIKNSKKEVRQFLKQGSAGEVLPWDNNSFDFVFSINTLHNLFNYEIYKALNEIERVGLGKSHITIESYRNEKEKVNLLYWQLTCRAFMTPKEWEWTFKNAGYSGDYGCIYFE